MDLLKEEMTSDQVGVRVNAIHRAEIIAAAMPEVVESELVPYLESLLPKEDDEVLFAIAKVLGSLYPAYTKRFDNIVLILEQLAAAEETVVRDEAIRSLIKISEKLNHDENSGIIVPCVLRLANAESFTNKVSSIHLMSAVFDKSGVHQDTLRKKFVDLTGDDTPMIKRAVAYHIGVLASKMSVDTYLREMMPIFKKLAIDDLDSVRILCIEALVKISMTMTKDLNKKQMLPILIQMTRDKAWKVRCSMAQSFVKIAKALGSETTDGSLINIFSTLIQDPEGDVRKEAVINFAGFVKLVSADKLPTVLQSINGMTSDSLSLVRVGIYDILGHIAKNSGKDVVKSKVLPQLLDAYKKETDTEAKIECIKAIKEAGCQLGADFFAQISQPDLKKFLEAPNWRIRRAALEMYADIASHIKAADVFEANLQELFFSYLNDKVCAIREFGNKQLTKILEFETPSWVQSNLMFRLEQMVNYDNTYLKKVTAYYALGVVAQHFGGTLLSRAVTIVCGGVESKVANVRLVTVKILASLASRAEKDDLATIRKAIVTLTNDPDKDVKDLANAALKN